MADTLRIEIPIEVLDKTDPAIFEITKALESLNKTADKTAKSVEDVGDTVDDLGAKTKKTSDEVEKATKKTTEFDKSNEKTQRRLRDMAKEKYQLVLEALDKISPITSKIGKSMKSLTGKAWRITMRAADYATAPIRGVINLLKNPILQAGAILGISVSVKDTVDTYAAFEATMSKVKALSDANSEEMVELTEKAKEMGAKTKYSGTESAEAFTYMAQAGWKVDDMIEGIGGVMSLAASDGLDLASTTDIVSNALTAFNLKAKDAATFADVLAIASSATNTDVQQLGESFKYAAPVAGALGYNIQDVSLALGIMSNNAIKGSMAGTSLKTSLANMSAPTKKMREVMKEYNVSLTDGEGKMKSLRSVLDNLRASFGGLSEKEQVAAASTLFGKEAMAGMLSIINTSSDAYEDLIKQIDNSEGSADRMAETMQDNLAGAFEQLGGAIETIQLTTGERLKPYILEIVDMIEGNMPAIENAIVRIFDSLDKKVEEAKEKIADFTGTNEWKNADLFGKFHIAWDELIEKPFDSWWNSTGKEWLSEKANSIGTGLGKTIKTGILGILGINKDGALDDGISIGASFASGFAEGFDVGKVKDAVIGALKGIISDASIFGGNSKTSILSSLALSVVGGKGLFAGIKAVKAGSDMASIIKKVFGSKTPSAPITGESAPGVHPTVPSVSPVTSGATVTTGVTIASAIVAALGIKSGIKNLVTASNTKYDTNTKVEQTRTGLTKLSMVGAGAALGSVIPGVGTIIGAGVGGLAALTTGKALSNWLGDLFNAKDRQQKALEEMGDNLQEAVDKYNSIISKSTSAKELITEYEELSRAIKKGSIPTEKLAAAQERMYDISMMLKELFPNLISDYDVVNGKVGERIDLMKDEIELMDRQAKMDLENSVQDAKEKLPDLQKSIPNLEVKRDNAYSNWDKEIKLRQGLYDIQLDTDPYQQLYDAGKISQDELIAKQNEAIDKANELYKTLGTNEAFEGFDSYTNLTNIIKDLAESCEETKGEYESLQSQIDNATASLQSYYDASVQLINMEYGVNVQESLDQISTLQNARNQLSSKGSLDDETVSKVKGILPDFKYDADNAMASQVLLNESILAMKEAIEPALDAVKELNKEVSQLPTSKKINISVDYDVDQFDIKQPTIPGTSIHPKIITPHAAGGIMNRPHIGLVAEAGPEAIIPLSGSRRERGFELWKETGRLLGVNAYANGGIVGNIGSMDSKYLTDVSNSLPASFTSDVEDNGVSSRNVMMPVIGSGSIPPVTVSIGNIDVKVEGNDDEERHNNIRNQILDLADELGGVLAEQLSKVFSNMPVKGEC